MLAVQITKRREVRTIYVPFSPYWAKQSAEELAQAETEVRSIYKASSFRFLDGLTVYKRGQLTLYFDRNGYACEGYSYDACLFARLPASEDFPNGRVIWNSTQYSMTTNSKHRYFFLTFAQGPVTGQREVTEWYGRGKDRRLYTHMRYDYQQWDQRCEVANMPWTCTASTLRDELRTWCHAERAATLATEHHAWLKEKRARDRRDKMIASGKHLRLVQSEVA